MKTRSIRRIVAVAMAFGLILAVLVGCSVQGIKSETGNPILEAHISQIVDGKTDANDILGLFGAPTTTSVLGAKEVYIYKNCKVGGTGVSVMGIGRTDSTERCNSLSVTIERSTGIVSAHNFQKMFDAQ